MALPSVWGVCITEANSGTASVLCLDASLMKFRVAGYGHVPCLPAVSSLSASPFSAALSLVICSFEFKDVSVGTEMSTRDITGTDMELATSFVATDKLGKLAFVEEMVIISFCAHFSDSLAFVFGTGAEKW